VCNFEGFEKCGDTRDIEVRDVLEVNGNLFERSVTEYFKKPIAKIRRRVDRDSAREAEDDPGLVRLHVKIKLADSSRFDLGQDGLLCMIWPKI
jgi:hypothetical protein